MSDVLQKTRRTALTWDQEFKPKVKQLEEYLERLTGAAGVSNTDLFMLCLAVGFKLRKIRPIPARKSDAVRISYLKESHLALMKSVALTHTGNYMVLLSEDEVFDIVEQYAAGGLELLSVEMENANSDFSIYLLRLLLESSKNVIGLKD